MTYFFTLKLCNLHWMVGIFALHGTFGIRLRDLIVSFVAAATVFTVGIPLVTGFGGALALPWGALALGAFTALWRATAFFLVLLSDVACAVALALL